MNGELINRLKLFNVEDTSLSNLIESCGERFFALRRIIKTENYPLEAKNQDLKDDQEGHKWRAIAFSINKEEKLIIRTAITPEEAVALILLEIKVILPAYVDCYGDYECRE